MNYQLSDFQNIKHFIFDIDGVLTNGNLLIDSDGTLLRTMNIKDGYAMQLAIKKKYSISIISGAQGDAIAKRLIGLGIDDIHLGIVQKLDTLNEIISTKNIDISKALFMGDDMPDLKPMRHVAFACCPSDACQEIKKLSKYISPYKGGEGCVRDVIEKVLKLNNDWE